KRETPCTGGRGRDRQKRAFRLILAENPMGIPPLLDLFRLPILQSSHLLMNIIELLIDHLPTLLALIATGIFAGILAGLLGVGGGIVIVPVLFFIFQGFGVSPESAMIAATATSLATIVPTSISSIRSHRKKGNVDVDLLKRWSLFILIGVLAGSWLVTRADGTDRKSDA